MKRSKQRLWVRHKHLLDRLELLFHGTVNYRPQLSWDCCEVYKINRADAYAS